MVSELTIEEALKLNQPIIDVRSPGEYQKGHIPCSHNICLFSNDERAHVGTVYKKQSQEDAIKLGYKYVTPKLDQFIKESAELAPDGKVIVHCWRGGMRSRSFAQHLSENGFSDIKVIVGGYKAYRNHVLNAFAQPAKLLVLGGYTGSGKTHILKHLKNMGQQMIDLEGVAKHKGSAFGGIDQGEQPSVEQFENNLYTDWSKLDLKKVIWIEDESHNIGRVKVPMPLFEQMRFAKLYFIEIPKGERAKHLVDEYACCNKEALAVSIQRISRRLGGLNATKSMKSLENDNFLEVALIALHYYDKSYLKGMHNRNNNKVITIPLPSTNHYENALKIKEQSTKMDTIKLTQFSHGAGCGCKISPKVLDTILQSKLTPILDKNLIVGNDSRDDAAVYDMGNGTAIISTTDFFMPIVDDPFTFGKIAATNAISDVYAMGGKPLIAIAILGWPVNKIAPEVASQVLEGGRQACIEAGITLAGGHSIDSPEPIFGLAVTGQVLLSQLKRNDTATEQCSLYLTKPLGVGILTTAQKQNKLLPEHEDIAPESMSKLNTIGAQLAKIEGVQAMTDVTGFGLLGHLTEMCEGSKLSAEIEFDKIPCFPEVHEYIQQNCIPGGTHRNWESYGKNIQLKEESNKALLCDPQTSGGLLIAVNNEGKDAVEKLLKAFRIEAVPFGKLIPSTETLIQVI
jgi:selenide,water dikinase